MYGSGPLILTTILLAELIWVMVGQGIPILSGRTVSPKEVGMALFGPYILGVEMASILLLAGLVGAYHLARNLGAGRGERKEEGNRR